MDHTESNDSIISGFVSNLDHILKNKSGFRWQNCMSNKRQFPVNLALRDNTQENLKDILHIPNYPSTEKTSKIIKGLNIPESQRPSRILERVFRPEDAEKRMEKEKDVKKRVTPRTRLKSANKFKDWQVNQSMIKVPREQQGLPPVDVKSSINMEDQADEETQAKITQRSNAQNIL